MNTAEVIAWIALVMSWTTFLWIKDKEKRHITNIILCVIAVGIFLTLLLIKK